MILAALLPDELLVGYVLRMQGLNGLPSSTQLAKMLSRLTNAPTHVQSSAHRVVALVAAANELSIGALLRDHAGVGIRRLPEVRLDDVGFAELTANSVTRIALRPATSTYQLCPVCVEHDLKVHRFAYWRRSHHIPGRLTCPKHGVPLLQLNDQIWPEGMPDRYALCARPAPADLIQIEVSNPDVQRAIQIVEMVLQEGIHLDRSHIRRVLQANRKKYTQTRAEQFLQLAVRRLTSTWLATVVMSSRLMDGSSMSFVDCVTYSSDVPISLLEVASTAALLFESADEAIAALSGEEAGFPVHDISSNEAYFAPKAA